MATARDEIVRFIYEVTGDKDLAASAAALVANAKAGEEASEEVQKFTKALSEASDKAALIQKALSQKAGLADLRQQLVEATANAEKFKTELAGTETPTKKLQKAAADAEKSVASLNQKINEQSVALQKSEGALGKAGVDTSDLGKAYEKVTAEGNAAANALGQIGTASAKAAAGTKDAASGTKQLGEEADKSGNLLTLLADNLGKIVTVAAAVKAALAGIRFGSDAFKEASQVEDQLARIQATTQATVDVFEKFGSAIEAAAEQVNVSTNQAAAALGALVQQGQSADDALKSLVPTLQLAKSAQIDVAQAAGVIDDALDRFGLSASNAADVVDILVEASAGAKDGLTGIANAMQSIAPIARDAGLSFKDTAAILGNLQQNGFAASNAAKGLEKVFTDLADPASKLRENLAALGDDSSDFTRAIDTIAGAGANGRKALLDLDGSSRVLVTFLAQQGVGAIDRFSAGLDNAAGAANRTVQAINNTAGGAFDEFVNSIDRAAEELAKPFLAPVRDELQKLASEVSAFAKSEDFDELKDQVASLARDAVKALDGLIHGLDWKTLTTDAKSAIGGVADDVHTLAVNVDSAASALGKFVAAISAIKNLGDVGVDLGKAIFGGTTEAALNAALAVSKAKDAITGTVSDTTKALQGLVDAASSLRKGGIKDITTDAGEGADALRRLGDSASNVGAKFRDVESGLSTTAPSFANVRSQADAAAASIEKVGDSLSGVSQKGVPQVDALDDAMRRLGKTQADLTQTAQQSGKDLDAIFQGFLSGRATIEDVRAAFSKYADDLRASVANSDEWQKETVEDLLDVKAAALGIPEAFRKIGDESIRPPDFGNFHRDIQQASQDVEQYQSGVEGVTFANKEAASAFEELGGSAGSTGNLLDQLQSNYSKFAAVSSAAVKRFSDSLVEFFNGTGNFSQQAIADGTNIIRAMESAAQAAQLVQGEIDKQRQGVAALAEQYANMSDAALKAAANSKGGFDQLEASLLGDAAAAREGASAFDLLGAADLSPLSSALDAAAAKVEQLKEQAQQAKDALESIGDSLADQIDEILGNQQAIEQRRFENQLEQIKEEAEIAGTLNTAEYNKLVDQAKKLHDLKMQQIKEQQDAQKKADQNTPDTTPTPPPNGGGSGGSGGGNGGGGGRAAPAAAITVNAVLLSGDQKAVDDLTRRIRKGLQDIDNRSR
jgi:TP901 family phage tail tape measure protein